MSFPLVLRYIKCKGNRVTLFLDENKHNVRFDYGSSSMTPKEQVDVRKERSIIISKYLKKKKGTKSSTSSRFVWRNVEVCTPTHDWGDTLKDWSVETRKLPCSCYPKVSEVVPQDHLFPSTNRLCVEGEVMGVCWYFPRLSNSLCNCCQRLSSSTYERLFTLNLLYYHTGLPPTQGVKY